MKCPKCQHENPEDSLFCTKCGSSVIVEIICPKCGATPPDDSKFCNKCGQPLSSREQLDQIDAPSPLPTSFADGRYKIKEAIGEGSTKKVYLAHDELLDRDVAFQLIKTEGLDEASRTRITREAQAMGRLGSHQSIVTVYDLGEESNQPYIVTELMAYSVAELIEKADNHRLPIRQVLEIAESVCEGLEFSHTKGITHRDIKPGNIWLTSDGAAKIGDFGLAFIEDHTRLTMTDHMVGTVLYLPPEQAAGGKATIKSDLYSLGVMIYEMVAGTPPFVGDSPEAIIGQHINATPISPSWHNETVPFPLEALILGLLEKNPDNRPASASEVKKSLQLATDNSTDTTETAMPPASEKSMPMYRRVFVGRENQLKQLKIAFDNALSGKGSLAMVIGEPGIGKTALCEQLATYATMRGATTLVGHCYEEGSLSLPYLAFVEAIRTYVLNRPERDLRKEMGSTASEVSRIVSDVRDKLQVDPRPATNPDEDRYRLLQAIADFLTNASKVQPLLIILEDLHDADNGTLDLLVYITRYITSARLLIVGTYRDVEVDRTHPLSGSLAALRRVSSYERVLLRGLTIDEVQRMLSSLSGQNTMWQIAEAVHRQTEGNPLFVQEVLRYAVEDGLMVRESGEWRIADPDRLVLSIPEGLRDVIGKRLSNLSQECGQVLSIASVIGREFRFEILTHIVEMPEDRLFLALQEAIAAALLAESTHSSTAVEYHFTHAFIRQALYEEMIAPRRNQLHILIGSTLEKVFSNRLKEHAAEIFEHFSHSTHSKDLSKAIHYGRMAAERAMLVYDSGEAVRLLEKVIQIQEILNPTDKEKHCDILIALCDALIQAAELRRVLGKEIDEAYSMAESLGDDIRISRICQLAIIAYTYNDLTGRIFTDENASKWIHRADQFAKPNTIERIFADNSLARESGANGRYVESIAYSNKALDLAERLGDNAIYRRIASRWISSVWSPQYSEKQLSHALKISKYPLSELDFWHLNALVKVFLAHGNRKLAERKGIEMKNLAERSGHVHQIIISKEYSGAIAFLDGHLEKTIQIADEIESEGQQLNMHVFDGALVGNLRSRSEILLGKTPRTPAGFSGRSLHSPVEFMTAYSSPELDIPRRIKSFSKYRNKIMSSEDIGPSWLGILYLEASLDLNDLNAIELLYSLLNRCGIHTTALFLTTSKGRILGKAAACISKLNEAKKHYEKAIKVMAEMHFRPELALTRFQMAELLFEHYPDEKDEALKHLDFAHKEFEAMKMKPYIEKANNLIASFE